ncbi:hypothetical protein TcasGA2_TC009762 [Tribolium castaneum]|uniref:Uncharacterized protein n=1 Tax=Tribolium castaneum TaxID=7070 RepID=D6WPJ9_TRICA|nr:hypothetical protein TcasGA2_TC009762 [Tribolium castaneum]
MAVFWAGVLFSWREMKFREVVCEVDEIDGHPDCDRTHGGPSAAAHKQLRGGETRPERPIIRRKAVKCCTSKKKINGLCCHQSLALTKFGPFGQRRS